MGGCLRLAALGDSPRRPGAALSRNKKAAISLRRSTAEIATPSCIGFRAPGSRTRARGAHLALCVDEPDHTPSPPQGRSQFIQDRERV
jgi:hypothetical protein